MVAGVVGADMLPFVKLPLADIILVVLQQEEERSNF